MALNASGQISLAGSTAGQSIAAELGQSATGVISLNDSAVRSLAAIASGAIAMNNLWGKSKPISGPAAGGLWGWGRNNLGQIGDSTLTDRTGQVQIGALTTWSQISDDYYHTLSIKSDGSLWAWGTPPSSGALGLGNTSAYSSPKQVGALTTWAHCQAGQNGSFAIKTDGTLWSWGAGGGGQLGHGNTTNFSSPRQVGSLTNWLKVASASYNTLAIKTDGTLWSWGINNYGQLGSGGIVSRSSPVQVGSNTNWSAVAITERHGVGLKTDGTLWTWGTGTQGALGHGNTTNYFNPKQVGALTNWAAIAAPNYGVIAVKTDGTLWSWGLNNVGQQGVGDKIARSSPVQVGALTTWSKVSAGYQYNCFGIRTDGTLWAWGAGTYGQLGLENTTSYSSPKQVGSLTTWLEVSGGRYMGHAIRT